MDLSPTMLPHPADRPELYDDTPAKRAVAWCLDTLVIGAATVVSVVFLLIPTFGLALLLSPLVWAVIGFFYRTLTLSRGSATWGMRLMSVEIRHPDGGRLDFGAALAHTALYYVAWAVMPLQLLSALMMAGTARKQGLGDHILGTAAVNHDAR